MNYVGIDWAYGRAAWCARSETGTIAGEGMIPADEDGLARLVLELGTEVEACVEMMSGAVWVRDQLECAGWQVKVAHARKVRDVAATTVASRSTFIAPCGGQLRVTARTLASCSHPSPHTGMEGTHMRDRCRLHRAHGHRPGRRPQRRTGPALGC
jgi:hypothetical protein